MGAIQPLFAGDAGPSTNVNRRRLIDRTYTPPYTR
jgi:hypothetical protein